MRVLAPGIRVAFDRPGDRCGRPRPPPSASAGLLSISVVELYRDRQSVWTPAVSSLHHRQQLQERIRPDPRAKDEPLEPL